MQRGVFASLSKGGASSSWRKKISFVSFFQRSGPRKKNLFGDEMNAYERSPSFSSLFTTSHHDGSLFFDSGSAREQSRFAQGTINERALLFSLFRVLSSFIVVLYVRARCKRKGI